MLTPIDIQNVEFEKATFGYNKSQVEEFVADVARDYEKIYKENIELKDKVSTLNDSLKSYKAMEESLQNTLMFAQNTAEDVKKNANEKADVIISEATVKAQAIIDEAEKRAQQANMRLEALKNEFRSYKAKVESIIDAEKKLLEDITD